jgi:hypothetical protein
MIPTSVHAELRYNGVKIGRVRSIEFQTLRDALETTTLEKWDKTFIAGLRESSASGSLFYDPDDTAAVALISDIYDDSTATIPMEMIFDSVIGKSVAATVVITNVSMSASFGAAQVCEIQFRISGKPTSTL